MLNRFKVAYVLGFTMARCKPALPFQGGIAGGLFPPQGHTASEGLAKNARIIQSNATILDSSVTYPEVKLGDSRSLRFRLYLSNSLFWASSSYGSFWRIAISLEDSFEKVRF
jgi:hypothetical protein